MESLSREDGSAICTKCGGHGNPLLMRVEQSNESGTRYLKLILECPDCGHHRRDFIVARGPIDSEIAAVSIGKLERCVDESCEFCESDQWSISAFGLAELILEMVLVCTECWELADHPDADEGGVQNVLLSGLEAYIPSDSQEDHSKIRDAEV